MLQVKNICKEYRTGNLVQKALDNVSLNLRENEFVAILGPSGSGKTTLLNIIGGLDRYDSGDLIINGISTKKYKDRDWDSYRNHTIGFVFQSYNLIPHQTVLANVELALTISGISKTERRQRAVKALEEVGLGNQLHKKPNQMSGGQMQRVAIARALVNDPDILLADEPTGALDSDTSIQVMDLLKEVAKDRLVVMVTHNPELAYAYATRIVNVKDGKILSDSDPFIVDEKTQKPPIHKNMGKASMSFLTALSLSFNNLRTKKARTILTAFAGSIGIIGIALILALSNGVNAYIQSIERDTLSEYPLQIQNTGMNFSSLMSGMAGDSSGQDEGDVQVSEMVTSMLSTVASNDLASLKTYLESGESGIEEYARAIEYSYNVSPLIYRIEEDGDVQQVNPDQSFASLGLGGTSSSNSMMSSMMSTNVFYEMPENEYLYIDQYEVKAGRWPEAYNECVLVLTPGGSMSDFLLYALGLRDYDELEAMVDQFADGQSVDTPSDIRSYSYDELLGICFKLVNPSDFYEYDEDYSFWRDRSDNTAYVRQMVESSEDLTIVGIVQPADDGSAAMLNIGINYTPELTEHIVEEAAQSAIVQEQLANPDINVLTGEAFGEDNSSFEMDSILTINEDAMQDAFSFDESALDIDISSFLDLGSDTTDLSEMIDFGSLDLSSVDLPEMPGLDLSELLGQVQINVSTDKLVTLATGLISGYSQYAAEHPEADFSGLAQNFGDYLKTPEASQIIKENIQEIIAANNGFALSSEAIQKLITNVVNDFIRWISSSGTTIPSDPDQLSALFAQYLQTEEAQAIIAAGIEEIAQAGQDIQITPEMLEAFSNDLLTGYQQYAQANSLPDPSKIGEHISAYLATPQATELIASSLASMIDTGNLQSQIASALQGYMQSAAGAYMEAIGEAMSSQISSIMEQMMGQISDSITEGMQEAMGQLADQLPNAIHIDGDAFANAIEFNMTEEELSELLMSLMSAEGTTYDSNLQSFGYADLSTPSEIDIYSKDFESKEYVVAILDEYNSRMEESGEEDKVITYTDMVGTLMSSVTDIIDTISYVLVAFVSISLIVSSIMIGILTYTSVLERKKEIGILRAIGASKRNISQVFNAETFIIGLTAGLIGIGMTLLLLIPGNAIIHSLTGDPNINAVLPVFHGTVLVVLSVILTLIGGLFPARKAAASDPVTALRTE